ncbi:TetR/AcrR family transcriptional regulator [Cereibacter sphaeroides]|uniref:TetR/AcrR family transcriptional regulator n=1 Tax=Cereibacter sphaeroides TaxID=1063 RepID=UPI001F2C964A|nr:TetR/AcrR family transcriptional regulator [Cereibacter sphaeroides]MCE6952481.1 TetR/AcrR family transcriptional regulator [Cereibacter sphaeroides]MCE6960076.1 TetR/AcrR family transcriptional regulator [Cereibacter sphaeroides]MCE6968619.1 TetR/AcrR family transcriptional regulator [Cereibacter sphaeroides]MCE6973160.1 TetR/AcrR family transcriptional regulator [Cereibacter sphaeroides]
MGDGRTRLLEAATRLIREQGFAATSVDAICREAGVTKGAFFHHFPSKQALGVAAAENWAEVTGRLFAEASYHEPADPLDRVFAYIDFRRSLLAGEIADYTCLVGTMVQEAHGLAPIREACGASIFGHAGTLEADIAAAMAARGVAGFEADSLARHMQAVLQGAFILAKAGGGAAAVEDALDHLKRYIGLLFTSPAQPGSDPN